MSNSGLECVGSCLQCCSEYQRGEARRARHRCCCCPALGTAPPQLRWHRPCQGPGTVTLTPATVPVHGDSSRDVPLPLLCPPQPAGSGCPVRSPARSR